MDFMKQTELGCHSMCVVDCLSGVRPKVQFSVRKESDSNKICLLKFLDYYGVCISVSEGRSTCAKWRSEDQLPKSILSFLHEI